MTIATPAASAPAFASGILRGQPLAAAAQQAVLDEFHREGVAFVRNVLTPAEVKLIVDATDLWIDNPPGPRPKVDNYMGAEVLRYTQSLDRLFCDMLVREPFLSLAEAVLGVDCGFVGQNVIRGKTGGAIARWHVDDFLEFPLPPEIPRHDARMRMPIVWFSFQIALSDIEAPEHGPTQVVRGTHYSGRNVPPLDQLTWEGRGPEHLFCKAGDIYLFNHQLWHQGGPITGTRTRYLMQNQYSKRVCNTRFGLPENGCKLPAEALAGAEPRLMRMLGR
ncbi:MAG: phytanoyl-CoA dioxygenase family protein [Planctomycetota bacterium]|nr:phytanoyl-CoA dioxygenase family protein [Planctomycetota bacterium]